MVTFEVKPLALSEKGKWTSIFRMGLGGDMDKYGDRTPAVFICPD